MEVDLKNVLINDFPNVIELCSVITGRFLFKNILKLMFPQAY